MEKEKVHISESAQLGAILAVAGGFMDAYSYLGRGKVFANAQTGNLLLFGVNFAEGNIPVALTYCAPVLAFVAGIVIAEVSHFYFEQSHKKAHRMLHWRQAALVFEMVCLTIVCFIPQSYNLLANSITSMACGAQVETFRKFHGNGIATTMCIGNLRSGTENMCHFFRSKNTAFLKKSCLFYGAIVCFIFGAVVGNFFVDIFYEKSILICVALLLIAFVMIFFGKDRELSDITLT